MHRLAPLIETVTVPDDLSSLAPRHWHKVCAVEAAKRPGWRRMLCGREVGGVRQSAKGLPRCKPCHKAWPEHLAGCVPCQEREARDQRRARGA